VENYATEHQRFDDAVGEIVESAADYRRKHKRGQKQYIAYQLDCPLPRLYTKNTGANAACQHMTNPKMAILASAATFRQSCKAAEFMC
jgi:hypothetical protein